VVLGDDGPAIAELADGRLASVDHRLDGEDHAFYQLHARTRAAVVQHLRVLMEDLPDAVTAELAHDREARGFRVPLDGVADVAERGARAHLRDTEPETFPADVTQPPRCDRGLAGDEHPAGVPVEAILDDGDVEIDDVAMLQHPLTRDAMTDLVVHRGADRLRKGRVARWRVVERRGHAALHLDHVAMAERVELAGGDPGANEGRDVVEDFTGQPAGDPHRGDLVRGLQCDGHATIIG